MSTENVWLYGPTLPARACRGFAALLDYHAHCLREGGDLSPSAAAAALEDIRLLLERLVPQQKHWSAMAVPQGPVPRPAACIPGRFCTAFSATAERALHEQWGTLSARLEGRYQGCMTAPDPFASGQAVLQLCIDGTRPRTADALFFSAASGGITRTFCARPQSLVALEHDDCGRRTIRIEGDGTVMLQDAHGEKTCRDGSAILVLQPSADGRNLLRVSLHDDNEKFDTGKMPVCQCAQRFSPEWNVFCRHS